MEEDVVLLAFDFDEVESSEIEPSRYCAFHCCFTPCLLERVFDAYAKRLRVDALNAFLQLV
jgi:hypothetical protein